MFLGAPKKANKDKKNDKKCNRHLKRGKYMYIIANKYISCRYSLLFTPFSLYLDSLFLFLFSLINWGYALSKQNKFLLPSSLSGASIKRRHRWKINKKKPSKIAKFCLKFCGVKV